MSASPVPAISHVLLSRPMPELDALSAGFEAEGVQVLRAPAFAFEATDQAVEPDRAWQEAPTRLLLFTSPRSVSFGLRALDPSILANAVLASIGPATSSALKSQGLAVVQAQGPAFDSEALLETLRERLQPGAAMILAAPGGRRALLDGLQALGWSARLVPVYRRRPLPLPPAVRRQLEAGVSLLTVWTSANAMAHTLEQLEQPQQQLLFTSPAIVVSSRLEKLARERGFGTVVQAPGASNDDLLECFRRFARG